MNSPIDWQRSESLTAQPADISYMGAIWRTIRGYILWSYERGSLHYDIMVTLILLFVFVSPIYINFNDKPVERNPHPTGVVVLPDEHGGLIYQIPGAAISVGDGIDIRQQLQRIVEPISGAVSVTRYETVKDGAGHVQSYKVWVVKE
ncbi:MAG TPA: hypothetical protein VNW47_08195 [Terriglobales bacterium]|jgi:hypothetical protein|nr:hypothetical protein [Terriglobales bacterium]